MQTAAVAPSASEIAALNSGPFEPFLEGAYSKVLDRPRGHPALPDDEWDDNATEEEKFIALKAAIDEGIRDYEEGRYFKFSSFEELRAFIREVGDEARASVGARGVAQHADAP